MEADTFPDCSSSVHIVRHQASGFPIVHSYGVGKFRPQFRKLAWTGQLCSFEVLKLCGHCLSLPSTKLINRWIILFH